MKNVMDDVKVGKTSAIDETWHSCTQEGGHHSGVSSSGLHRFDVSSQIERCWGHFVW